jgi:peptidoglycan/LPS O-acetylase OafA/YrhL/glycosyltransferase involved in cell wall biosynthesis
MSSSTSTQAKPASGFHIPSLDGIRAAAVGLVFAAHAGLNDKVPGNFGVTVFFFLSGYLITTLMRMEADKSGGVSLPAFYLRRVLRILPPMYLVLIVASLLTAIGFLQGQLELTAVLAQVFHLSNYYIVANGWWDGRAPGTWIYWSLAVEEHFYLVFPLVYIAMRRWLPSRGKQFVALLTACAVVLAWRIVLVYIFDAPKDRTYVATDTRVDSILFGCALAVWGNPALESTRVSERVWKYALVPLGLVGLLVSFLVRNDGFENSFRYSLQGIALFPLFVGAIRYPRWAPFRILNWRPVQFMGVLSYAFYLVHPTVLFGIFQWVAWPPLLQAALGLAIALTLSWTIYVVVEKPCARLRRRLSHLGDRQPSARTRPIADISFQPSALERTAHPMQVSVVICTRNRPDLIGNAVSSVLGNDYPTFDLVVVDQSTDERTGDIVRGMMADHSNVRYIHTTKAGLSRAYNIGIRETTASVIAFTDDDCVAPTDWVRSVANAFESDASIDMLYGQVLLPAALADRKDDVPTLPIFEARKLSQRDGFYLYGMGANFAARRNLLERVGGFDEVLGGGGPLKSAQDYDLQYRVYLAGATVALRPEVKIDHYGLRSPEQWPATHVAYGTGDGAFYIKHVRCGDLYALRMATMQFGKLAVRELLHATGIRRRWSRKLYLQGFINGVRDSFGYSVDRRSRMYVQ